MARTTVAEAVRTSRRDGGVGQQHDVVEDDPATDSAGAARRIFVSYRTVVVLRRSPQVEHPVDAAERLAELGVRGR
jgi:hypothetical protein